MELLDAVLAGMSMALISFYSLRLVVKYRIDVGGSEQKIILFELQVSFN